MFAYNSEHWRIWLWRTLEIIPLTSSSLTSCIAINLSIPHPTTCGYGHEIPYTWSNGWKWSLSWIFLFKAWSVRIHFVWKNNGGDIETYFLHLFWLFDHCSALTIWHMRKTCCVIEKEMWQRVLCGCVKQRWIWLLYIRVRVKGIQPMVRVWSIGFPNVNKWWWMCEPMSERKRKKEERLKKRSSLSS